MPLNRGQSSLHFLEKFDISIQIDIFKLKQNKQDTNNNWTPLKINIKLSLLKLHIDDLKLTYIYTTLNSVQKLFNNTSNISNTEQNFAEDPLFEATYPDEFLQTGEALSSLFWSTKKSEFASSLSAYINIDLDEIDITMSGNNFSSTSKTSRPMSMLMERRSICELRIFNVNCELLKSQYANQLLSFKIFGLLLIDARQIYGTDYQLLAASHSQIELDSKTGQITERSTSKNKLERQKSVDNDDTLKPLIKMDLIVIGSSTSNCKEYILKSSFSMLDIVLNPETISELIMLFYSSYLSITSSSSDSTPISAATNDPEASDLLVNTASSSVFNRVKINFEFTRLSVLLFRIESFEKAKKIGLFELNGTSVQATILPEINYTEVISKIKGLKVVDLKIDTAANKTIFGIGLQKTEIPEGSKEHVVEIVYKKSALSELSIEMASLCYMHSAEFVYELQCCFNDFSRFQAKVVKQLTEKAASLAIDLYNKGKTYIKDTIADIYQQAEEDKFRIRKKTVLKLKVLLETPVIAIPQCAESSQLIVAHLGNIMISNGNEDNGEVNKKSRSKFSRSMDENLDKADKSDDDSESDLEKEIFDRTISDSTKFKVICYLFVNLIDLHF